MPEHRVEACRAAGPANGRRGLQPDREAASAGLGCVQARRCAEHGAAVSADRAATKCHRIAWVPRGPPTVHPRRSTSSPSHLYTHPGLSQPVAQGRKERPNCTIGSIARLPRIDSLTGRTQHLSSLDPASLPASTAG